MSDLIQNEGILHSKECITLPHDTISQKIKTRNAQIGQNLTIRRALPHRDRKTIGAWCFLDHFGPLDLKHSKGLHVPPHPHMGLQTFTYPIVGEILHKDSLGSKQCIRPGQINLMTAGKGIAHSEESLSDSVLHGVQLWIALPDHVRHMEPNFFHYSTIPSVTFSGLMINILAGEFANLHSTVKLYSPLVGLDLHAIDDTTCNLPLNPQFEYGILPLVGNIGTLNDFIGMDTLLYLSTGQTKLPLTMKKGSRMLIIGGEPFKEDILIWWNFVARTKNEILDAVNAWANHTKFGEVEIDDVDRMTPPPLT